jgi:hypothetical protein
MPRPGKLLFFAFYFCTELNLQFDNYPHFCSLRLRGIAGEELFFFETGHFLRDAYFADPVSATFTSPHRPPDVRMQGRACASRAIMSDT